MIAMIAKVAIFYLRYFSYPFRSRFMRVTCQSNPLNKYVKLFPNMLAPRFSTWRCRLLSFHMFLLFLTSMMGVRRGDGRGGDGRDQAREQQEQERNCPHGDYWRRLHVRGRSNTDRFHPSSPIYRVDCLLLHFDTVCI